MTSPSPSVSSNSNPVSSNSNPWKIFSFVLLGVLIGLVIAGPLSGNFNFSFAPDEQKKAIQAFVKDQSETWKFYQENQEKTADGYYALGKKGADITMVEYSDYQCPFCNRFFARTLPSIKENYIKTGKMYFVYKDLPLSNHPNAFPAAEAAHCAGEQGKYFQMHDLIFNFADYWSDQRDAIPVFVKFAKGLNLKRGDFEKCLKENIYKDLILKSMQEAEEKDFTGTPAFSVNGETIIGAQDFVYFEDVFKRVLELKKRTEELTREKKSS